MSRRTQRVGSSPTGPIKKADREKLASLDRRIDRKRKEAKELIGQLSWLRMTRATRDRFRLLAAKKEAEIAKLDQQRKALRIWMKSCVKR